MKWIVCWVGICFSLIGLLNMIFYTHIEPLFGIPESIGVLVVGLLFVYIGREYLPAWLCYLFSGDDSGSE
ncbi:hypothetical protein DU002_08440 [Corallincola holothuriorum]|uniref:Uncharacterized protein n=1 Tax=Corallincola holothuriorum TaxID=2282215 RepID=A0A368NMA3_9GAMM|nr:hypothetical protein DU002_08440 [Corallincola holothuriorum]